MQINISEILSNPSVEKEYNLNFDMESISFRRRSFPVTEKKEFVFSINRQGKKMHISLDTEVSILIPCDRCLDDVAFAFPVSVDRDINLDRLSDGNKDEDELLFIDGYMLDVDKLISDEIVVALPSKVLCSEDCKGLCPVCGTNLNHDSCHCDREVFDPRMAIFKDFHLE